jgi:hypothetical protein
LNTLGTSDDFGVETDENVGNGDVNLGADPAKMVLGRVPPVNGESLPDFIVENGLAEAKAENPL